MRLRNSMGKCLSRRMLADYLYGHVEDRKKRGIEDHLGSCLICYTALKRLRKFDSAFDSALKRALFSSNCASPSLRSDLESCLECARHPGSFPCPRLRRK